MTLKVQISKTNKKTDRPTALLKIRNAPRDSCPAQMGVLIQHYISGCCPTKARS